MTLGIYNNSWRSTQAAQAACAWAASRNINTIIKGSTQVAEFNDASVSAIYVPIRWDWDSLSVLDNSIPLIIDIDTNLWLHGLNMLSWCDRFASDRVVATRNFAEEKGWKRYDRSLPLGNIRFQVPYIHLPLGSPFMRVRETVARDLVFIDYHKWETKLHDAFLKYLALARYFDPSLVCYCNLRDFEADDVLPFEYNFDKFCKIFSRLRVFISTHNWLNDMDVFNAYISGAPILHIPGGLWGEIAGKRSYYHPMQKALLYLEPRLMPEFADLQACYSFGEWDRMPEVRYDVPSELYANAYFQSWDLLWEWALSGSIDKNLEELTINFL